MGKNNAFILMERGRKIFGTWGNGGQISWGRGLVKCEGLEAGRVRGGGQEELAEGDPTGRKMKAMTIGYLRKGKKVTKFVGRGWVRRTGLIVL